MNGKTRKTKLLPVFHDCAGTPSPVHRTSALSSRHPWGTGGPCVQTAPAGRDPLSHPATPTPKGAPLSTEGSVQPEPPPDGGPGAARSTSEAAPLCCVRPQRLGSLPLGQLGPWSPRTH